MTHHRTHSHPHARSARLTGLSNHTFFGYTVPFGLTTCMRLLLPYTTPFLTIQFIHPSVAALVAVGEQVNIILNFFLRRNIAIAKKRVWEQTVASRGKGPSFWKPYVEEWDRPPVIAKPGWDSWLSGSAARFVIRRSELEPFGRPSPPWGRLASYSDLIRFSNAVLLYPVQIYPFIGIFVSAYLTALGTGTYLHKPVRHRHHHHRLYFRTIPLSVGIL